MKTIARIGLGLLAFGFVIAVLGAIVIRTSAPRPPVSQPTVVNAPSVAQANAPAVGSPIPAAASAAVQNQAASKP